MKEVKPEIQKYYLPQMDKVPFKFVKTCLDEMGIECRPVILAASQLKILEQNVDLNKIKSISEIENPDDELTPLYVSENLKILDGRHRLGARKYKDGEHARVRCIRIAADEKDGASMLRVIQDRWERLQKPK